MLTFNGNKVEGKYNPSSDTATHVVLYNAFHEHRWNRTYTFFLGYKLGTGRKMQFHAMEPHTLTTSMVKFLVCADLTKDEIEEAYEKNTGVLIASDCFKDKRS